MTQLLKLIQIVLFSLFIFGCADSVPVKFFQPAKISLEGVRTIAVDDFKIVFAQRADQITNKIGWRSTEKYFKNREFQKVFEGSILHELSRLPQFQSIHLNRYKNSRKNKFRKLISVKGETAPKIDALMTGKIFLNLTTLKGFEYEKVDFRTYEERLVYSAEEKKKVLKPVKDQHQEKIVSFPFDTLMISGIAEIEIIKTAESTPEVIAHVALPMMQLYKTGGHLKNLPSFKKATDFNDEITDQNKTIQNYFKEDYQDTGLFSAMFSDESKDHFKYIESLPEDIFIQEQFVDVLPTEDLLASHLAKSIAELFAPYLLVTEQTDHRNLIKDGDEIGQKYIMAGAIDHAVKRLEKIINEPDGKNAANLYHLALCYETLGDYGAARIFYNEALDLDPENEDLLIALGSIEAKMSYNKKLREQLSTNR